MRFTRILATGLTAAALAGTVVFAEAHNTPEAQAIAARQAHMTLYSFNLGALGNMAKGAVEFNADAAQAAADNLAAFSGANQMAYWLPGTSNADTDKSRALPAIWAEGSDAAAKGMALHEAALVMAANAGTLDGVRANMKAVGGACGACHKPYRAPE